MATLRSNVSRLPVLGPVMFDFIRALRRPGVEREIKDDLAATTQSLEWLREAVSKSPVHGKTLLVFSLTDMVYQLKLEAMLAAGLRLKGWRVRILIDSPANTRALRYFRAFGLNDFIYLDRFSVKAQEAEKCVQTAAQFLDGPMDFTSVKNWHFENAWIGPQILSAVSRATHQGAPDPETMETRQGIADLLPGLLQRALIAKKLVAEIAPDLGLAIEANDYIYGPFVDQTIGAGIDVIQVTQPWRDDALTMRRLTKQTRRMHPSSVASETLDRLCRQSWGAFEQHAFETMFADRYGGRWFLQARNQPDTKPFDRPALTRNLGLDPEKPIAVVFSHVLWDANLFYGEDLFKDYGDWFVETVRAANANPSVNWLIKMHPANLWKRAREGVKGEYAEAVLIQEKLGDLAPHVTLLPADSDINTLSLFQHADFGVTVRGTSGMEMPCFGKPTLTAGSGRYANLGFTVDSQSREEYLQHLASLHLRRPLTEAETLRARWHAYAAFVLRPWHMQSFRSVFNYQKTGVSVLDHNLEAVATTLGELQENEDLSRWAAWAASKDVDYLENLSRSGSPSVSSPDAPTGSQIR
jgi:hypothetical protein